MLTGRMIFEDRGTSEGARLNFVLHSKILFVKQPGMPKIIRTETVAAGSGSVQFPQGRKYKNFICRLRLRTTSPCVFEDPDLQGCQGLLHLFVSGTITNLPGYTKVNMWQEAATTLLNQKVSANLPGGVHACDGAINSPVNPKSNTYSSFSGGYTHGAVQRRRTFRRAHNLK
jgi:hypothetical protein